MSHVVPGSLPRRSLLAALLAAPAAARGEVSALAALREGRAALLLRHATAPGVGDPPGFRLGDCATQRNLDAVGRAEAAALGARLRAAGLDPARVGSSRWCRALETARLLGLGPVEPWPALDSFFAERGEGRMRTDALARALAEADGVRPLVLVTHQVNIAALTGVATASAEGVIVARDDPRAMLARLR